MARDIICGIYKITSPSGRIYVGQSIDVYQRFYNYTKCNISQRKLKNSFNKYGIANHKFEIIHICGEDELNELEIFYIKKYDTFNTNHGLNLRSGGEGNGKMSEETKIKIAQSKIGKKRKPFSEEAREKMRQSQLGRTHTQETKDKMSRWQKGVKKGEPSEETKKKISDANRGKKRSDEYRRNNTHRLGIPMSEETKKKIGDANRGRKWTQEQKDRYSVLVRQRNALKKAA